MALNKQEEEFVQDCERLSELNNAMEWCEKETKQFDSLIVFWRYNPEREAEEVKKVNVVLNKIKDLHDELQVEKFELTEKISAYFSLK